MPAPATAPWFMPEVEAVRAAHAPDHPHRRPGERGHLDRLGLGQVGVVGDVPVRADQQVPGVVRIQVEHREDQLAARHHQALAPRAAPAPRRTGSRPALVALGPVLAGDVGHPVRRPEPLQAVRLPVASSSSVHRQAPYEPGARDRDRPRAGASTTYMAASASAQHDRPGPCAARRDSAIPMLAGVRSSCPSTAMAGSSSATRRSARRPRSASRGRRRSSAITTNSSPPSRGRPCPRYARTSAAARRPP